MVTQSPFPKYKLHEDVQCIRCARPLHGQSYLAGYDEGRYCQFCPHCGAMSFYDVEFTTERRQQ